MTEIISIFAKNNLSTVSLLRKSVYLWVALNSIIILPMSDLMLDFERSIQSSKTIASQLILQGQRYLEHQNMVRLLLIILIGICVFDIFFYESRIHSLLIFSLFFTLENICIPMWDGGVNIVHLLLVYLIFSLPNGYKKQPALLTTVTNNCVLYAAQVQVVLVYLCAGLLKVHGQLWGKGIALYYTLSVEQYSHPTLMNLAQRFPSITVLGTYLTLIFQLSFPFLIWFRGPKQILLFTGMMLHLGIAFGMGLPGFGLAMCTSYLAFCSNQKAEKILNAVEKFKRFILAPLFHARSYYP